MMIVAKSEFEKWAKNIGQDDIVFPAICSPRMPMRILKG